MAALIIVQSLRRGNADLSFRGARAAKPAADVAAPPRRRGQSYAPLPAIVLLSVAAFASAANMRVIDPLLVQLAASFDVTVGEASIAATAFLFANGVFVLVHGPFGDRYGIDAGGGHRLHRRARSAAR